MENTDWQNICCNLRQCDVSCNQTLTIKTLRLTEEDAGGRLFSGQFARNDRKIKREPIKSITAWFNFCAIKNVNVVVYCDSLPHTAKKNWNYILVSVFKMRATDRKWESSGIKMIIQINIVLTEFTDQVIPFNRVFFSQKWWWWCNYFDG